MLKGFRKWALGAAFAVVAGGAAFAANIPLVSGPLDPANIISTLNNLIQSFNNGVTGNNAVLTSSATTSGTALQALFTYTMPGGQLSAAGQMFHVRAWGTNSADANAKTLTFAFGAATCALTVTGSGNEWSTDFFVVKSGANTQNTMCQGVNNTTALAPIEGTGTVTDTAAVTVSVSGTAATAGTMTLAGAYVEQLK